jgi:cytochrome c-type biogenesis protein CcmE
MTKGTQIALATLSIFAGIAWLLTRGEAGEGTFAYYSTVSEYVEHAQPASSGSARGDRVHGFVVEGSIHKDLRAQYVDFVIRDDAGATLPVRLENLDIPDMFMDGAEVVVEGHLGEKTFVAQKVLAKCPSKYEVEPGSEA